MSCRTAPYLKQLTFFKKNFYKLKILKKAHKFYYSRTNENLMNHSYNHCRSTKHTLSRIRAMEWV